MTAYSAQMGGLGAINPCKPKPSRRLGRGIVPARGASPRLELRHDALNPRRRVLSAAVAAAVAGGGVVEAPLLEVQPVAPEPLRRHLVAPAPIQPPRRALLGRRRLERGGLLRGVPLRQAVAHAPQLHRLPVLLSESLLRDLERPVHQIQHLPPHGPRVAARTPRPPRTRAARPVRANGALAPRDKGARRERARGAPARDRGVMTAPVLGRT